MNLTYKKATIDDIEILTETRITVLRAANKLSDDVAAHKSLITSTDSYLC